MGQGTAEIKVLVMVPIPGETLTFDHPKTTAEGALIMKQPSMRCDLVLSLPIFLPSNKSVAICG